MGLPVATQLKYWGVAAVIMALAIWLLSDILLPFVLGGAFAYMLDPLADRLERLGLSRLMSTIAIAVLVILVVFPVLMIVFDSIIVQAVNLFATAPEITRNIYAWLIESFPTLNDENSQVRQSLIAFGDMLRARSDTLISGMMSSFSSIFNIIFLIVIVPVITFYLLLDWDNMTARIDELLPRDHRDTIRRLTGEMNQVLSSFIRGQGTVCLILGTYYGAALMVAGLNFGMIVGFIAGLISFIPYVGSIVGGTLAIGLALFQYFGGDVAIDGEVVYVSTDWFKIGLIAGIFALGQFLEGNILSPNLIGNSVGLHPAWLIFALSVSGSLFGFVGLLLAVPMAAMIGVMVRFLAGEYKRSKLYKGLSESDQGDA